MLILDRDGVRIRNGWADHTAGQTLATIDLPADLVLRDSAVIDRLIDAVFDHAAHWRAELMKGRD